MYVKSTRPSAKREVQKERSAQRDDQIARPRRAQTCERSELRAKRANFFISFEVTIEHKLNSSGQFLAKKSDIFSMR